MKREIKVTGFNAFEALKKKYISLGEKFTVISTGYSLRLELKEKNTVYFLSDNHSINNFQHITELKKEIQNCGQKVDFIPREIIRYYEANENNLINLKSNFVYCLDINSAYLSVLKRDNFISEELFNKINSLPKEARLKTVGSIATEKTVIHYEKGTPIKKQILPEKETEEWYARNAFFYACMETGKIMEAISKVWKRNFLFYWVDGIYLSFEEKANPDLIEAFKLMFSYEGMEIKIEELREFKAQKIENHFSCTYQKNGKEKTIIVPSKKNPFNLTLRVSDIKNL